MAGDGGEALVYVGPPREPGDPPHNVMLHELQFIYGSSGFTYIGLEINREVDTNRICIEFDDNLQGTFTMCNRKTEAAIAAEVEYAGWEMQEANCSLDEIAAVATAIRESLGSVRRQAPPNHVCTQHCDTPW